jgi:hypothetical protein
MDGGIRNFQNLICKKEETHEKCADFMGQNIFYDMADFFTQNYRCKIFPRYRNFLGLLTETFRRSDCRRGAFRSAVCFSGG